MIEEDTITWTSIFYSQIHIMYSWTHTEICTFTFITCTYTHRIKYSYECGSFGRLKYSFFGYSSELTDHLWILKLVVSLWWLSFTWTWNNIKLSERRESQFLSWLSSMMNNDVDKRQINPLLSKLLWPWCFNKAVITLTKAATYLSVLEKS